MNVLVWKFGALGDLLMCTPLLRQLRRAMPNARITALVGQRSAAAIAGHPACDRIETFDERALTASGSWRLPRLMARLARADRVFVLDKHQVFGVIARMSGVPSRIGFNRFGEGRWHSIAVPYGAIQHEIDCYLDLLAAAGQPVDASDRALDPPRGSREEASEAFSGALPAGYRVLINAGGINARENSMVRRLPAELFDAVLQRCRELGPVVFLGNEAEREAYPTASSDVINLAGRTTLNQAAAVLRGARAVITTDCGLMHLAGAVGVPTLALFGPTHPLRKCPPGARALWTDETTYDPAYETFGKVPSGRWFERMTPDQIMAALPR